MSVSSYAMVNSVSDLPHSYKLASELIPSVQIFEVKRPQSKGKFLNKKTVMLSSFFILVEKPANCNPLIIRPIPAHASLAFPDGNRVGKSRKKFGTGTKMFRDRDVGPEKFRDQKISQQNLFFKNHIFC